MRDSEQYRLFNVAILRDSWVLEEIERDAAEHQMPGHVNKLLALRITEYYRLIREGKISAAILGSIDVAATGGHEKANGSTIAKASPTRESTVSQSSTGRGSVGISGNAETNADAALDFFEPLE
jgi:hypothetical protein